AHTNLAFALTMDRRWDAARTEYRRVLELDPSSKVAKARLDQLNAILAKLEPTRSGAPRSPQLLTTSTAATPPRLGVPTRTPPASARSLAPHDPALLPTARAVVPPRQRAGIGVAVPPRPAEGDTLVDQWWVDGSAAGAPARWPSPVTATT